MGSAEAGMNFGISGGLNYAWGNAVPFFILIPMVMHLRKKMPKCTTFTEFIEQRYNRTTSKVFFLFGVGVIIYVLVAQAVGIGIVFNSMFGIPYEIGAAVPIAIAGVLPGFPETVRGRGFAGYSACAERYIMIIP